MSSVSSAEMRKGIVRSMRPSATCLPSTSNCALPGLGKPGRAQLLVDGKQVAEGRIERTIPFRISADETLDIGEDTGTPVSEDYHVPFRFTGDLRKLAIQLTDAPLTAEEQAEIERMRANNALSE